MNNKIFFLIAVHTVICIQFLKEFVLFSVEVKVDQTPVHLQLCDTAGQVGIISPLSVPRDISSLLPRISHLLLFYEFIDISYYRDI